MPTAWYCLGFPVLSFKHNVEKAEQGTVIVIGGGGGLPARNI